MKKDLVLGPLARAKMEAAITFAKPKEIGGFLLFDPVRPFVVRDIFFPKQKIFEAYVEFDDTSLAEFFEQKALDEGEDPRFWRYGWWHHHPFASAHPSPKDEDTFAKHFLLPTIPWAIMLITSESTHYCRLTTRVEGQPFSFEMGLAHNWFIDHLDPKFPDHLRSRIIDEPLTTPSLITTGAPVVGSALIVTSGSRVWLPGKGWFHRSQVATGPAGMHPLPGATPFSTIYSWNTEEESGKIWIHGHGYLPKEECFKDAKGTWHHQLRPNITDKLQKRATKRALNLRMFSPLSATEAESFAASLFATEPDKDPHFAIQLTYMWSTFKESDHVKILAFLSELTRGEPRGCRLDLWLFDFVAKHPATPPQLRKFAETATVPMEQEPCETPDTQTSSPQPSTQTNDSYSLVQEQSDTPLLE